MIEFEIIKKKLRDATVEETRWIFEAQLMLKDMFDGPIYLWGNLDLTIAKNDKQIIGCLLHYPETSHTWIQTAYVMPEYRHEGVFRKLLSTLSGDLALGVSPENDDMKEVMKCLGFKPTNITFKGFARKGTDA